MGAVVSSAMGGIGVIEGLYFGNPETNDRRYENHDADVARR